MKLHLQLGFSAQLSGSPDVVMPPKEVSVSTHSSVFPQHSNFLCVVISHPIIQSLLGAGGRLLEHKQATGS